MQHQLDKGRAGISSRRTLQGKSHGTTKHKLQNTSGPISTFLRDWPEKTEKQNHG